MWILTLYNFIRGYVCFSIENGFYERFINLCTGEKISLWDIEKKNGKIYIKTDIKGFEKISEPVEKASVKLEICKKVGVPFIIKNYYKRRFLFIGTALFLIILPILSGRVWCVTVTGNNTIPDEKIISILEKNGVKKGSLISKLDAKNCAKNLLNNCNKISWAAVNFQGSFASVEVKETVEPKEKVIDETKPSNIIASCDGELVYTEIYKGLPTKKTGSGFAENEILVSGVSKYKDEIIGTCHSEAYIEAQTKHKIKFKKKSGNFKKIKKIRHSYRLKILNFSIPLLPSLKSEKNAVVFDSESYLKIGNVMLPFGIATRTKTYYEDCKYYNSKIVDTDLIRKENFELEHLKILDRKITRDGAEYLCLENVGIETHINVEK